MKFQEERIITNIDNDKIIIDFPVFYRPARRLAVCERCGQKWQDAEVKEFKKKHFILYEDVSEAETREDYYVCECEEYIRKKYNIHNVFLMSSCIHLSKQDALRGFALRKEHGWEYKAEELTVIYSNFTVIEYPATKIIVYCHECRDDQTFVITHDKLCVIAGLVEGKTNFVDEELKKLVFEI